VGRLDAYATEWVNMRYEACRATRAVGDQSEDLLDRRMVCLESARRQLDALVGVLRADAATVDTSTASRTRRPGTEQQP
jgi:eukaryotic-like serine/threonine-protein kinase